MKEAALGFSVTRDAFELIFGLPGIVEQTTKKIFFLKERYETTKSVITQDFWVPLPKIRKNIFFAIPLIIKVKNV